MSARKASAPLSREELSSWFHRLRAACSVPLNVAACAAAMMAALPPVCWHKGELRAHVYCVACIRIAYKWFEETVDLQRLRVFDSWCTGPPDSASTQRSAACSTILNWIAEELDVLSWLGWNMAPYVHSVYSAHARKPCSKA